MIFADPIAVSISPLLQSLVIIFSDTSFIFFAAIPKLFLLNTPIIRHSVLISDALLREVS